MRHPRLVIVFLAAVLALVFAGMAWAAPCGICTYECTVMKEVEVCKEVCVMKPVKVTDPCNPCCVRTVMKPVTVMKRIKVKKPVKVRYYYPCY